MRFFATMDDLIKQQEAEIEGLPPKSPSTSRRDM